MTDDKMVGRYPDSMDMSLSKLQEIVKDRQGLAYCCAWGHKELDTTE